MPGILENGLSWPVRADVAKALSKKPLAEGQAEELLGLLRDIATKYDFGSP
jgi:hypothetical protein